MNNDLSINNEINLDNNTEMVTYEKQKSFLESNLGQIINGGINIGIRALLPDLIEDQVINVKDSIITDGFKSGIKTAIDNAVDLGKSFLGIFTGKFDSMSQVKETIKKGGLIDSVSEILDWGVDMAEDNNLINKSTASLIKKGKDTILNTVNNNIENSMTSQIESIEKIDKYITNWNEYYNNQDFSNMEKQFKKIEKELEQIMPLESVINKARVVENLHNLIKNNGKDFNLSNEELELANKLV
ncbi:MAG: hypothetical protein J5507_00735 [Clostridia bacterium]|nr:hypothetical protein [Clostridia bacterium]